MNIDRSEPISANIRAGLAILSRLLLLGMGVGCALPWLNATGIGLTANAYDLAEWLSLHPTVRATSQILLPALALRLVLAVVLLLAATQVLWRGRIALALIISLTLWVGLLPPVAFFRGGFADTNYLQQAILWAGVTMLVVVLWRLPQRLHVPAQIALGALGVVSGVWGGWTAIDLMGRYGIPVQVGPGLVICMVCLVGFVGIEWWEKSRHK